MNALTLRDDLFSALHQKSLKPLQYKKKGHWSTREVDDVVHSFYLRASRFGSKEEAVFWIDVQVFSKRWHELLFKPLPYTGPTEGKPSLLSESLGRMATPPIAASIKITSPKAAAALEIQLITAADQQALPLLATCTSYEGLLTYLGRQPESTERFLASAGLLRLLQQDAKARDAVAKAKSLVSHENELKWLEVREWALWQHAA